MLNDHTKDVPLRTSESFILDYLKATRKEKKQDDEKYNLPRDLNLVWSDLDLSKLPKNIQKNKVVLADLKRRVALIEELRGQLTVSYTHLTLPTIAKV